MTGRVAARVGHQLPLRGWLVLVWVLLWGDVSWANVLSGLVVALAVTVLLPLPAVGGQVRPRPIALLALAAHFVLDLVTSSAQIAWETLRPQQPGPRAAIIAVQLRTDSDALLTLITAMLTLVPGSVVLDLDRERRMIAVHVLPVRSAEELTRRRAEMLATEDRVVRALGTAADRAALRAGADPERSRP